MRANRTKLVRNLRAGDLVEVRDETGPTIRRGVVEITRDACETRPGTFSGARRYSAPCRVVSGHVRWHEITGYSDTRVPRAPDRVIAMRTTTPIQQRANEDHAHFVQRVGPLLAKVDDPASDADTYQDALEELQQEPLSVEKLATHWRAEENEWEILLCTGGPAVRILVRTDFYGCVLRADYQFQDWFEPWTSAEDQDEKLIRCYAETVGWYEELER
jgi:hypothetical protein